MVNNNLHSRIHQLSKEQCMKCGTIGEDRNLHIHHIDLNFTNNNLFNLTKLCAKCHTNIHLTVNGETEKTCFVCKNKFRTKSSKHIHCNEGCRRKAREILEAGTQEEYLSLMESRRKYTTEYRNALRK